MAMFENSRREERNRSRYESTLDERTYNLVLGGTVLYGFVVNALTVHFFKPTQAFFEKYFLFIIAYILCIIVGSVMARSANPVVGFVGYNFIVAPLGIVLTVAMQGYSQLAIRNAIIMTGLVVILMIFASTAFPNLFLRLAPVLGIAVLGTVIVEIVAIFLGYRGDFFNWLVVGIFSLYLGFDWYRSQNCPKTVPFAIASAVDIYLDIFNILIRLIQIFGRRSD